jgi:hypothetical protein
MELRTSQLLPVVLLTTVYGASLANFVFPTIRFHSQAANHLFFALMQLIPVILIDVAARWRNRTLRRNVLLGFAILLMVPAAPLGLGAAACAARSIADGADRSFERINSMETARGSLAVYRTDRGATTSFGIVLRQECHIAPGILVVRHVGGEYPAHTAQLERLADDSIRASFPPYGESRRQLTVQIVHLRRLPCLWDAG